MGTKTPAIRTSTGTFAPGVSGNPSGRPRNPHRVRDMARAYTEQAVMALVEALEATKIVGLAAVEIPDHGTRINAACALLDRGYGKPSSAEVMAREDEDSSEAAGMSDQELLNYAIARAKTLRKQS